MKFGIMSLDYKRLTLEETFYLAGLYGFDGVEIFGSRGHLHPSDYTPDTAGRVISLREKYEIEIPMYTPLALNLPLCICSPDLRERREGVEYYKKAVQIASDIGCRRVLVVADHPGYFTPEREVWGYLVESMREICRFSHGKNVEVTIEPLTPMESPVISTVDDCVKLLEDVDDSALYAMMDIVPPTIVKEPISKYFHMLGDRLNYIHLCNNDGVTDAHLRLDQGVLPVPDIINVIHKHGYTGFVTTELYSENFFDPELMLSNTARNLKEITANLSIGCSIR